MTQARFNSAGRKPRLAFLAAALASLLLAACVGRPAPGEAGDSLVRVNVEEAASWPSRNVAVDMERHDGRFAVRIAGTAGDDVVDKLVVLPFSFGNGTIELEMAGTPNPVSRPTRALISGWRFEAMKICRASRRSRFVQRTHARTTRSGATAPPNISPSPIVPGIAFAGRRPGDTRAMSISRPAPGRVFGSWSGGAKRNSMSTTPRHRRWS